MSTLKREMLAGARRLETTPLTRVPLPPEPRPQPTSGPWLYSTLLGNGRMLACLDDTGAVAQLFYPAIDRGPNIRCLLLGILTAKPDAPAGRDLDEAAVSWLAGDQWEHHVRHVERAAVVSVTSTNSSAGIQVERTLTVDPERDVLITEVTVTNLRDEALDCKLVTYAGVDIDYRQSGTTAYFDALHSALSFFSRDCYLSVVSSAEIEHFSCEKLSLGEPDHHFEAISRGEYTGREYAIGVVSGALCHALGVVPPGGSSTQHHFLCGARTLDEVTALTVAVRGDTAGIAGSAAWWQTRYGQAHLSTSNAAVGRVYERSLMVLRLLTDWETGGMLAAAECDPDFRSCGGYGACWPRDGAFLAHALDVARQHDHARAFYDWALRVQHGSGVWYQRYSVAGELAPVWGLVQFDETGAIVWAICRHIQLTGDDAYGRKVFPQLLRACEYMRGALDQETGLAPITKDLWEERDGISSYACACTWGAFEAVAELASRLGEADASRRWAGAATELRAAIETHLWEDARGRFLRGLKLRVPAREMKYLQNTQAFAEGDIVETLVAGKPQFMRRVDAAIDVSLLGLSVPFGVLRPDDPRMLATAEAVAQALTSPVGGIRRYQDDTYRGGNPWIICTLWLAWQDLRSGNIERALAAYNWALEHRTALDLLPEQVDRVTGKPCWVVPLAWSHAMFILVSHALDERGLLA